MEISEFLRKYRLLVVVVLVGVVAPVIASAEQAGGDSGDSSGRCFTIRVVDRQTGRGVPLVELRTVNNIRHFTDSNGIIAFYEPGLMNREVFFFVESHGYRFPKDGFAMQGTRLKTEPGKTAVIKIDRINIAERLYRVTGQGIYRDSILTGRPVPLRNPVLNGQVVGQDSVFTCIYGGRLFWMWGDTARPSYPLGNFAMSGAFSDLPEKGGLDPAEGVNLEYLVGEDGFSRPIAPMKEPGLVWLDGLMTLKDNDGRERMVAGYARLKGLGEVLERGLMVFNDTTQSFEPIVRAGVDFLPFSNTGHAFGVNIKGQKYYYFTSPAPVAVRMRVKALWDDVVDANRYEVLTGLEAKASASVPQQRVDMGDSERPWRWIRFADLLGGGASSKTAVIKALEEETSKPHVYDIESGKEILSHNGTVYFNDYRQRWVAIFVQHFGESSFLGEVWCAEADTPVGPWGYARKIVTHNKYSFYNPKQHPHFDRQGGRVIFFEGTYSHTFSGSPESATPRYDYNQIMYRLDLADPRLTLPVAVYQVADGRGGHDYIMRIAVEQAGKWDAVEAVAFYAIEPDRAADSMIPIYRLQASVGNSMRIRLAAQPTASPAEPSFYALPPGEQASENPCVAPLYEYSNATSGEYLYSTRPQPDRPGWDRTEKPLCRVWKVPARTPLLDRAARPIVEH
jgi:hypothetical protein